MGGWTTFNVSVGVAGAGDVGAAKSTGTWELWRLDMRGLGVPPVNVVQLVALGILLPKSSAMPHHRRLKRFLIKEERRQVY
jgi:hypothetical protein